MKVNYNKLRTRLGLVVGFALFLFHEYRISVQLFIISILIITAGEFIRIWASGHLNKNRSLATTGPYKFCRNPLYIGSLLILTGFLIIINNLFIGIFVLLLFTVIYLLTVKTEEENLKRIFEQEFTDYASTTPRIIPDPRKFFVRKGPRKGRHFSFKLFISNQEYQAVMVIAILILAFRFSAGRRLLNKVMELIS